jgi:prepilin-type N-terminal cleavage/methylation domain-containing protein
MNNFNPSHISERSTKRNQAFTLLEMSISLVVGSMILACVTAIFIMLTKGVVNGQSLSAASSDSSNATAFIINATRSAAVISLPGDLDFAPQSGYSYANYQSTYQSSTVAAAMTLWFPATASSITFTGATRPSTIYDRTNLGSSALFYRANSNGAPNPSAGAYLWVYGTINGVSYNQAIMKSVASAANAVQFMRPSTSISNEVEVKVVSGYYSPQASGSLSEEASGGHLTTTLTGKCVINNNFYTGTNTAVTQNSTNMVSGGHWYSN